MFLLGCMHPVCSGVRRLVTGAPAPAVAEQALLVVVLAFSKGSHRGYVMRVCPRAYPGVEGSFAPAGLALTAYPRAFLGPPSPTWRGYPALCTLRSSLSATTPS